MLESDRAGLVEARLDVLLAVWNRLVLFNVALEDSRKKGERRMDTGAEGETGCLYEEYLIYPVGGSPSEE